jgi:hypothetical protein
VLRQTRRKLSKPSPWADFFNKLLDPTVSPAAKSINLLAADRATGFRLARRPYMMALLSGWFLTLTTPEYDRYLTSKLHCPRCRGATGLGYMLEMHPMRLQTHLLESVAKAASSRHARCEEHFCAQQPLLFIFAVAATRVVTFRAGRIPQPGLTPHLGWAGPIIKDDAPDATDVPGIEQCAFISGISLAGVCLFFGFGASAFHCHITGSPNGRSLAI